MSRDPEWLERENELLRNRLLDLEERLATPEIDDFFQGVKLEAVHQRERWGSEHDEGKSPPDWFWLIGYLAGKALHAAMMGDVDKLKHHCVSTAAALFNWHSYVSGTNTSMRPGIRLAD